MGIDLQLTQLAPADLAAAVDVQSRAFFDDPGFVFTFPDERSRIERLPWVMQIGIACGIRFGHVDTTAGRMLGHAVWLPPGATSVTPDRLNEVGFADAPQRMGEQGLARFGTFMAVGSAVHERLVPGPHWYLMILGVDPPFQGKGVGSALIQPTLSRADADRLPCYLDTTKQRNVWFYEKHGFRVRHEEDIEGGLHVWMMVREPR